MSSDAAARGAAPDRGGARIARCCSPPRPTSVASRLQQAAVAMIGRSTTRLGLLQQQLRAPAGSLQLGALLMPEAAAPATTSTAARAAAAAAAGVTIDLSGKTALVTGATGQLGRVMVRTLATAGCDVVVHYRSDEAGAAALCVEVRAMGRRAMAVYADVGDADSVNAMHAKVVAELGDPDIVVTNAVQQITGGWKTVLEQDIEAYEGQFRTSVLQNVLFAKAYIPGMVAKGEGRFIGINTECAMQNYETQSAYTSGTAAVTGYLLSFRSRAHSGTSLPDSKIIPTSGCL